MDPDQYSNALAGPDSDDEDDGSHFVSITAGGHHVHSQSDASNFAAHTDFGQPELSIDPNLSAHPPPPRPHEQQQRQQLQRHQRQDDPHHQHGQHGHYVQYSDLTRDTSQYTLGTPSEQPSERSPSHFASASPAPHRPKSEPSFTPTDRSLPEKQVTDETLDDAYVTFILYCNPSVPLDCDTAELRKVFRQPPKSDGKTFSTYHLLQLIEKFERKDIKTWTKLAIELGVERTPDSSAQKVQQYAVRLKVAINSTPQQCVQLTNQRTLRDGCMRCTSTPSSSTSWTNPIATTKTSPPPNRTPPIQAPTASVTAYL